MSCSRTQHGGGRSRTPDLSLRSPTLYHWAIYLGRHESSLFKYRRIFANGASNASTLLLIYSHTIHPILLYWADVWGFISPSQLKNGLESFIKKKLDTLEVEEIHKKNCKFVLGVKTKSWNDSCRGKQGSLPVLYSVLLNMIKCWYIYYIVTTPRKGGDINFLDAHGQLTP